MFSNSPSTKSLNNSKRFFTPIVASSLALFLSAGVAAADTPSCGATDSPKICYTIGSASQADFTDNKLTWENKDGFFSPTYTDSTATPITELKFEFNQPATGGSNTPAGTHTNGAYTITSGSSTDSQSFILDAQGKSLQLSKLAIDFGNGTNQRDFYLNLDNAGKNSQSRTPVLKGNLDIKSNTNGNSTKIEGIFGGSGIEGDITITDSGSGHTSNFIFRPKAGIKGNITATPESKNTFTFEGDGFILGNISGSTTISGQGVLTIGDGSNTIKVDSKGGINTIKATVLRMQVDTIDGGTIQDKGNTIQAIQQGDITIKNLQGFNTLDLKNTQIKIDNVISTETVNNIVLRNGSFEAGVIKTTYSQQNYVPDFKNSIVLDNAKIHIKKLEAHTNSRNEITISNSPYVKIDEMIAEGSSMIRQVLNNEVRVVGAATMRVGSIKALGRFNGIISGDFAGNGVVVDTLIVDSIESKAEGEGGNAINRINVTELQVGKIVSSADPNAYQNSSIVEIGADHMKAGEITASKNGNISIELDFGALVESEIGKIVSTEGGSITLRPQSYSRSMKIKVGVIEANNANNAISGDMRVEDLKAVNGGKNEIRVGSGSSLKNVIAETGGENSISSLYGERNFIQTVKAKTGGVNKLFDEAQIADIEADGDGSRNLLNISGVIDTLRADNKGVNLFGNIDTNQVTRFSGDVVIRKSYSTQNEGKNVIQFIAVNNNTNNREGIYMSLESKEIYGKSIVDTYGKQFRRLHGGNLLQLNQFLSEEASWNGTVLNIKGLAVGDIFNVSALGNYLPPYGVVLTKNSAFVGGIALDDNRLVMEQGAKLLIDKPIQDFGELTLKEARFVGTGADILMLKNTTIDLASMGESDRKDFRLLSVGSQYGAMASRGLAGANGLFSVLVNTSASGVNQLGGLSASNDFDLYGYAYSDRVVVHELQDTNKPLKQYIQVLTAENTDYTTIAYQGGGTETQGNIAVFSVKNDQGKALIDLEAKSILQGYDEIRTTLTSTTTDANGKTNGGPQDYTTYFIDSMGNKGASKANQLSAITALSNNYMLYLANLNSLNKRMGELRENTASQGAWLRIFNGMQSTNFKEMLDSRAIYTTIQAGYDYTFGFKGASNYLGFALSYANALGSSESYRDINGIDKGLKNMNSNAFELAIYNAYVQDGASKATGFKNGLYSDSIAKFSYILGSYNFLDQSNKTYDTSNFAFTLSQELGYRFLLGADKEFYIDPQAELAFGFFSNSNLAQSMGNNFFLKAMQDSILTLRSRVGSSFGYKFDKFTQNKGFNSSLYLGTYFVSDVLLGGEVSINTNANKPLEIKPLTSDMRFVLNLGTNFKIKDNTRIYFDFERSFGGKITTDYQLNLGVRYSFGTSKYTPYTEANTQEIKDSNTLKEVEPTQGYYIELLEKEDKKLTNKELKTLQNLKEELRIQTKTQNNKTLKAYLAGPYKDEKKAKEAKTKLEGVIKELKGKGSILEVEDEKEAKLDTTETKKADKTDKKDKKDKAKK